MAKKIKVEVDLEDKQAKKKLEDLENKKYKVNLDVDGRGIEDTNNQVQKLGNTASSTTTVFGKLKNVISNTFSFNKLSTTGYLAVLNEINQAGKNAKETINELDKAITDLSVATNMSRDSVSSLLKTYNDYAKELKSTTVDVSSAADDYLRAGKSMSETQALIKDSIMLSKLGQLQSGEATEDLLATMNGYEMSVDEVEKALDAMVAVDLEASTSAGDIASALKYCASSADMAGVSFSKLTGMIAETQDKTMQSAETIGVFYNTLLSRYRDIKIGNYLSEDGEDISDYESVLKSVGVNLRDAQGDFRNFEVVLDELAGKWSSLTSVQQAAVIKVAAGTRQQNRFIALMEGYDKVLELTETAANSAGTAVEKFNNSYANSLEAKQNTLQASFESMIMNSDFDEVYGGILEATTALVNFINETNALKGAMSGLTIGAGIKAFIAIKGGINEAYIELNKFQNALKIVKKTEISTESFERLKLLCDGLSKSQMKLVLSTNQLSVEQKKELLMASSLSEEEATLQLQTWNMAKANNGLTTSTTSVSNAFKGLWATIKANKFMLITSAIMIGVSAINKYKETLENARSAAEDAKSTLSDMNKSVTDNGSWLAENTDKYKELSDGVNSLGQNVSLTDEEFKEYNTLTNEIAEMFPTLVTGYTDTGTAILSCKNNVDLLTKAYEEQKQAAQDAVIRNADDLVSGFNADTTNTNLFENNGMSKVDQLDLLNKMLNGNISNVPMDLSNTILKNAGVKVSWLESLTYDKGELDKKIQENKEQLYAYKRTLESEMEAATSDITPLIDYFLDTNKNFNELDESTKAGIKQVADNMGYEFYNSLASGEELTKTDLANWVDNTLLPSISNNGNANKAFSKLFTLNADDMPVSEYVTTVNDLVSKICMAVGGDPDKIKINLGFDVQADEDLLDKVYKVAGVDGSKFYNPGSDEANQQKELKSWIDSLNKDDLKLIAQGEVEFDEHTTVESAKEALKEAQSYADENPIEANATISSVDALAAVQDLSNGLDQLDSIYADILDGEDFDWGSILNNKDFQDIFGSMGETYENFINTVTNNPADISACQAAFDDLSNAYIYQSGVLDELNESNAQAAINMLDSMGVANAEAVVMNYLAAQTEYAAIAKDNAAYSSAVLAEATLQDINNILMEGSVTEDTKNQIVAYYLEKLTASGISLDTAEDCNQLINLIDYLGGATDALRMYYSALQGSMNVTAVNGDNSHGGLSGKDTPYLEQMAKVQAQKETEKKLNEMLEKTQNSMSKVSFKGGTKSNGVRKSQSKGSGSGSGSKSKDNDAEKAQKEAEEAAKKAEEERKKAIEEEEKRLEDALSRIKNAIAELDKQASNSFHNWDERNSALQAEMDAIPQAISAQQQLVDFYNSTGNDPTKAQEAANAIADLKRQLEELANQKLENIKKFNEDIISLIDSLKELSQSLIDIKEARGFSYSEGDYQELIAKTEEERRQYEKELSELQAQLQENIDKGYLQEGSETWYEWQKELNGIKKSINECTKAQIEWNKEIQNIPFTALENFHKLISKATDRLDKFEAQLSARGLSKSFANIQEDLMAVNEELLIAQSEATQYYEVIRKNLSDDTNGWARLTEEQIKQIFKYIDTDDSLSLHNYMSSLGYDNYTLKEFYEYIEKLSEANSKVIELKTQQIELNNAISDLDVTGAEKFAVLIEKLNSEISDANSILDARGVSKNIEDIKNEYHGLASTVIVEQNKINHYYSALYRGLSDGVNGWANLTYEEIDKVFKYIQQNDTNSLFNFLNSKQINPATLDGFWELVENIQTANSNIASATANQIQLNKAIQQMDISVYENLSNVLSEIKTRIEGIRSIVEAHKRNPADELIQMQIDTGMDQIELYRSMINAYKEYIIKQLSDGKNGWANLAGDQIQDIMGFVESGDTNGLEKYLNTLGLSIATMDEFNEVLGKITSTSSNMYSEMASQETRFDDMLEVRINKLNEVQEQLQKINDEKNKALQLEKARYALIEAQNNRNVMTWDGNQMVWTNDKNKVSDALDNLKNLEFQDLIDSIDEATEAIQKLMKNKNIYDEWGNLTSNWQNTIDSTINKADAIMTELISKLNAQGYNVRIPAFATGGAIQGLSGDNNLIRVADKERVLTPIQNAAFEKLVDFSTSFIPQLEDITKNLVPLTNFDAIRKVDTATQNVYQFNGDFVMPNVHDGSKVNDLIKDLNSITLKAQQRVNRIN